MKKRTKKKFEKDWLNYKKLFDSNITNFRNLFLEKCIELKNTDLKTVEIKCTSFECNLLMGQICFDDFEDLFDEEDEIYKELIEFHENSIYEEFSKIGFYISYSNRTGNFDDFKQVSRITIGINKSKKENIGFNFDLVLKMLRK